MTIEQAWFIGYLFLSYPAYVLFGLFLINYHKQNNPTARKCLAQFFIASPITFPMILIVYIFEIIISSFNTIGNKIFGVKE